MFRSLTSESQHRPEAIKLLFALAIGSSGIDPTLSSGIGKKLGESSVLQSKLEFHLRLETVRQLELCLAAALTGVLPHGHRSVQSIIDALCDIFTSYGRVHCEDDSLIDSISCGSLALAAIIPLARLRVAQNGHAVISERSKVVEYLPEQVLRQTECQRLLPLNEACSHTNKDIGFCDSGGDSMGAAPFTYVDISDEGIRSADEISSEIRKRQIKKFRHEGVTITFQPIVSSICQVFNHFYSQSEMKKDNIQDSFEAVEFDKLSSFIRVSCYQILSGLVACSFPVKIPGENIHIFSTPFKTELEYALERTTRSNAAAAYAGLTGGVFINIEGRNGDWATFNSGCEGYEHVRSLIAALLSMCFADEASEVSNGCRGLSALLASLLLSISDNENEIFNSQVMQSKKSLVHDTFDKILTNTRSLAEKKKKASCMKPSSSQETVKQNEDVASDPLVSPMSLLYDILSFISISGLSLPKSSNIETVAMCMHLCATQHDSWISVQARLLSLLCSATSIDLMLEEDTVASLKKAQKEHEDVFLQSKPDMDGLAYGHDDKSYIKSFPLIIVDMLMRKYYDYQEIGNPGRKYCRSYQSQHETFAKEMEDLESFPVAPDVDDRDGSAMWICGTSLLMCRVGHAKSRHRGWIEVTVRSPSHRVRRLVRLPQCNSISDPEFLSPLWDLMRTVTEGGGTPPPKKVQLREVATGESPLIKTNQYLDTDKVLSEAFSTIMLFDRSQSPGLSGSEIKTAQSFQDIVSEDLTVDKNSTDSVSQTVVEKADVLYETSLQGETIISSGLNPPGSPRTSVATSDLQVSASPQRSLSNNTDFLQELAQIGSSNDMIFVGGMRKKHFFWGMEMDAQTKELPNRQGSLSASHADDFDGGISSGPLETGSLLKPKTDWNSVRHWLESIMGNAKNNITRMENELLSLGFSDSLIDTYQSRLKESGEETLIEDVLRPVQKLQMGPRLIRAINILDRTAALQTHKIALFFAGSGSVKQSGSRVQSQENNILSATQASPEFISFSRGLGSMVMNCHLKYFSGGLDTSSFSADGMFTLVWISGNNNMLQGKQSFGTKTVVLFHAVTLMPPGIINRKRHVGNDVVHIVYVERRRSDLLGPSGLDANSDSDNNVLISGDFGLITIFVIPFEQAETVKVTVKMRLDKWE